MKIFKAGLLLCTIFLAACNSDSQRQKDSSVVVSSVPLTAWIGSDDSLLQLENGGGGYTLYSNSSNTDNCYIGNYIDCKDGQLNIGNGEFLTDTATLTRTAYYTLVHEKQKANLVLRAEADADFSGRMLHQLVSWQNRLWLIGGNASDGDKNDIWSSSDGVNWKLEVAHAEFSPRAAHQVVSYKNKLWLIGGSVSGKIMNDIWSSTDGIHWLLEAANSDFSARAYHQVVAYEDKLWLVGGKTGELANKNGQLVGMSNDVWSSTDGVHWLQQTDSAAFLPRMTHHLVVFRNKLWLMGGFNLSDFGEVWSSQDGIHWVEEVARAEFGFRNHSTLVVYNDYLWLIGGSTLDTSQGGDSALRNDVWASADGIHWEKKTAKAEFKPRWGLRAVNFNERIMVIGGDIGSGAKGIPAQAQNDVWSSVNGSDWRLGVAGQFEFK